VLPIGLVLVGTLRPKILYSNCLPLKGERRNGDSQVGCQVIQYG